MEEALKPQEMCRSFLKRHAVTLKMVGILILVFILLIPLGMIRSVVKERMHRRNEAVSGITSSWGGEQTVVGPVLVIPYQYKSKKWKDHIVNGVQKKIEIEETAVANAFFLPDDLSIEGSVTPKTLHRGIYDAVVYTGSLEMSGRFSSPDFAELGIVDNDVQWEKALVTMAVSDLRGTGKVLTMKIGDETVTFAPGCRLSGYKSGVSARIKDLNKESKNLDFHMTLELKGSKGISFAPLGKRRPGPGGDIAVTRCVNSHPAWQ